MSTPRRAAAAAFLAALAGCAPQPDYPPPEVSLPAAYSAAPAAEPERPEAVGPTLPADAPGVRAEWWQVFGSPELDALIEEGLKSNLELKAALDRLAQARATIDARGATLLPQVDGFVDDEFEYPEGGPGSLRQPKQSSRLRTAGFEASYELDLWGRNRSQMDAALAAAEASAYNREAVAMSLMADIALSYLSYLENRDRAAVARRNVENMMRVLRTVEQRYEIGEGTALEVAQQRDAVAQAEATVPTYELQAQRAHNRLAVLVGRPPQSLKLRGGSLEDLELPRIDPGLPSDLLLQRPDIRRAEADLRAANADIGAARANLLPRVSLTGQYGWGSAHWATLLQPQSVFYNLTSSLIASIFDGGRNAAEIARNEAHYNELTRTYGQTILNALRDVEDALAAVRLMAAKEEAQRAAVRRAAEARRLALAAYDIGMTDFLAVLEADRSVNRVEDEYVLTRFARLEAAVNLYKALGGGTLVDEMEGAADARSTTAVD